jgi:(R,R)-butanediol dehydrogenase/meso-butanediol dehydrogenase/diacetyl reductase/L-iditol 2-dehydrogenase
MKALLLEEYKISRKAPLGEGQIWFDKLYNREDGLLKVVLIP